jgi:hypothetical protein
MIQRLPKSFRYRITERGVRAALSLPASLEETVGQERPEVARALPPEDYHLMSQGDELKLQ